MLDAATFKEWTTSSSINGVRYTFSTGTLFLPAAGDRSYSRAVNQGAGGYYWSATYSGSYGWNLAFGSGNTSKMLNNGTYYALSVRCVRPK
jgi:hypothetical protein